MALEILKSISKRRSKKDAFLKGYYTQILLAGLSPNLECLESTEEGYSMYVGQVKSLPEDSGGKDKGFKNALVAIATYQNSGSKTAYLGLINGEDTLMFKVDVNDTHVFSEKREESKVIRDLFVLRENNWQRVENKTDDFETFRNTLGLVDRCVPARSDDLLSSVCVAKKK